MSRGSDAKYAGMPADVIEKLKERDRVYLLGGVANSKLNRYREDAMVKMGDPSATVDVAARCNDFVTAFNAFAGAVKSSVTLSAPVAAKTTGKKASE